MSSNHFDTPSLEKSAFLHFIKYDRILVLAPHCDDEVLGCGGMLLKSLDLGSKVRIVYFTTDTIQDSDIRKQEALMAWHEHSEVEQMFFDISDMTLSDCQDLAIKKLHKVLSEYQPEMILLPWPFDIHPDHKVVLPILEQALPSSINGYLYFYEVFYPLFGNYTVNISKYFSEKINMLNKFTSQLYLGLLPSITLLNQFRASCLRLRSIHYAESFYVIRTSHISNLFNSSLTDTHYGSES